MRNKGWPSGEQFLLRRWETSFQSKTAVLAFYPCLRFLSKLIRPSCWLKGKCRKNTVRLWWTLVEVSFIKQWFRYRIGKKTKALSFEKPREKEEGKWLHANFFADRSEARFGTIGDTFGWLPERRLKPNHPGFLGVIEETCDLPRRRSTLADCFLNSICV